MSQKWKFMFTPNLYTNVYSSFIHNIPKLFHQKQPRCPSTCELLKKKKNKTSTSHPSRGWERRGAQKRGDICICIADWLCYTAGETPYNFIKQLYPYLKKKSCITFEVVEFFCILTVSLSLSQMVILYYSFTRCYIVVNWVNNKQKPSVLFLETAHQAMITSKFKQNYI